MHDNVINVPTNVGQTESILSCLPHVGATIIVFLKRQNYLVCSKMFV